MISDVETKAVAGNDAYEERPEDGKIKITVKNSDGEAVKGATRHHHSRRKDRNKDNGR